MPDVVINIMFSGAPYDIANCITRVLKNKQLDTLKEYFENGIDDDEGIHYSVKLYLDNRMPEYEFRFSPKSADYNFCQYTNSRTPNIKTSDAIVEFLNKNAKKR
jgi:hypothetical protein